MAGLLLAVLLASIVVLPIAAWATVDSGYPYLVDGKSRITKDFEGLKDSGVVQATDEYFIHTEFSNPDGQPKDLKSVYYVVNVIDYDRYTHNVDINTYGNRTIEGRAVSNYRIPWVPLVPGNYTIETFLVSNYEVPRALTSVATFQVNVDEKIDALGEGESNNRLRVESINEAENSVTIAYEYCDEVYPYTHGATATLHPGERVAIKSVDAFLSAIQQGKAVFRFTSNGGTDVCLV